MTNRINLPERSGSGTGRARRKGEGRRGRADQSRRHRRLFMESLEERSLLAAIAKFDFDSLTTETGPSGWTHVTPAAAPLGVQDLSTTIGVRFTGSPPIGFTAAYTGTTVPSDAGGIKNGLARSLASDRMTFALYNLDPQKSYEVWVIGGNSGAGAQTQQVTVEGSSTSSFTQQWQANNGSVLQVNSAIGDSSKAISGFAPIF